MKMNVSISAAPRVKQPGRAFKDTESRRASSGQVSRRHAPYADAREQVFLFAARTDARKGDASSRQVQMIGKEAIDGAVTLDPEPTTPLATSEHTAHRDICPHEA